MTSKIEWYNEMRTSVSQVMDVLDISRVDQIDSSLARIDPQKFSSVIKRYMSIKNVPFQLCTATKTFLENRRSVGLMKKCRNSTNPHLNDH